MDLLEDGVEVAVQTKGLAPRFDPTSATSATSAPTAYVIWARSPKYSGIGQRTRHSAWRFSLSPTTDLPTAHRQADEGGSALPRVAPVNHCAAPSPPSRAGQPRISASSPATSPLASPSTPVRSRRWTLKRATSPSTVDAFHQAAVAAGGTSRHEPRYWPEYRAYAAFDSDPDGNNVEALVKEAEAS